MLLPSTRRALPRLVGRVQGRTLVPPKALLPQIPLRPSICARRMARRESIFATGHQGKGSHGSYRRTPDSERSCK